MVKLDPPAYKNLSSIYLFMLYEIKCLGRYVYFLFNAEYQTREYWYNYCEALRNQTWDLQHVKFLHHMIDLEP